MKVSPRYDELTNGRTGCGFIEVSKGVAQWVAPLTRNRWMPVSHEYEPIKSSHSFL